jgi:mRNA interferase RelE/StbE
MNVSVIYSDDALRQLKKLSPALAERIVLKVKDNAIQDNPLSRAKALQGELRGRYRYRVGDYRIIFTIGSDGTVTILTILSVKHRKDVYR